MSTKFCSLADVNKRLNVESGYVADDEIVKSFIVQASALIRRFTRKEWDYGLFTDYADGNDIDIAIGRGKNYLPITLREKPIDISMPIIIKYNVAGRFDAATPVLSNLYHVDVRKNQIVFYPSLMQQSGRSIRIDYYAGYKVIQPNDPMNIPPDFEAGILDAPDHLKYACIAQAAHFMRTYKNEVTGTTRDESERRQQANKMTSGQLVPEAWGLLSSETRTFIGS